MPRLRAVSQTTSRSRRSAFDVQAVQPAAVSAFHNQQISLRNHRRAAQKRDLLPAQITAEHQPPTLAAGKLLNRQFPQTQNRVYGRHCEK